MATQPQKQSLVVTVLSMGIATVKCQAMNSEWGLFTHMIMRQAYMYMYSLCTCISMY